MVFDFHYHACIRRGVRLWSAARLAERVWTPLLQM